MTPQQVQTEIDKLRAEDDCEEAHRIEDGLYAAVLTAIANGTISDIHTAREVCKLALTTKQIDFNRYYA